MLITDKDSRSNIRVEHRPEYLLGMDRHNDNRACVGKLKALKSRRETELDESVCVVRITGHFVSS